MHNSNSKRNSKNNNHSKSSSKQTEEEEATATATATGISKSSSNKTAKSARAAAPNFKLMKKLFFLNTVFGKNHFPGGSEKLIVIGFIGSTIRPVGLFPSG